MQRSFATTGITHPRSRLIALALALVGLLATVTAVPAASPSPADGSFDQAFVDMMVPHHEAAVAMAVAALARGEHEEIKQLAPRIIEAQELEIAQLRTWRAEWFGDASTPPLTAMPMVPGMGMSGMDGMTMDMSGDIRDLWVTDEPFDRAFIDAMIPHHQSAIEAATIALDQADRPEIKALAQDIIAAQQREIDEMAAWREAWYPEG